ncbi:MAG: TIGR04076 family protein [Promethearchaeota archaeon]
MTYKVTIEIVDILEEGTCPLNHKIGEKFEYPEDRGKICAAAFNAIYPYIRVLESGGSYSYFEDDGDTHKACCPDYKRPVVFKMTRSPN